MDSTSARPFRKNLATTGLIYLGGEEQEVVIKNLSLTGVLVELKKLATETGGSIKDIFNSLTMSTMVDLYIPILHLAGEVEVTRIDHIEDHLLLGLQFKHMSYDVDNLLYKRRVYRKNMPVQGQILVGGYYYEFTTVNVSVDGLMIRLNEIVDIDVGTSTQFSFESMGLKGEVKVIWVDHVADTEILVGLQYMNLNTKEIKGIPRFEH